MYPSILVPHSPKFAEKVTHRAASYPGVTQDDWAAKTASAGRKWVGMELRPEGVRKKSPDQNPVGGHESSRKVGGGARLEVSPR